MTNKLRYDLPSQTWKGSLCTAGGECVAYIVFEKENDDGQRYCWSVKTLGLVGSISSPEHAEAAIKKALK